MLGIQKFTNRKENVNIVVYMKTPLLSESHSLGSTKGGREAAESVAEKTDHYEKVKGGIWFLRYVLASIMFRSILEMKQFRSPEFPYSLPQNAKI